PPRPSPHSLHAALPLSADAIPATVAVDHFTKTYGDANPGFTVRYSGFVLGQGPTDLGGTLSFTTPATASSNVGAYTVTPGGLTSTNYDITFTGGTLDITPASLSVTADAIPATVAVDHFTKTYGDANPGFTVRYSGFVLGQGPTDLGGTLSFTTPATASSNVGAYTVTPGGLTSTNYDITFTGGTLDITPASLTIKAINATKTYADTDLINPSTDSTATGPKHSDSVTLVTLSSTGAAATASVGGSPYTITPSAAVGTSLGNYSITYQSGSLTVGTAALTVTSDNKTKVLNAPNPSLTVTYSKFKLFDGPSSLGGTLAISTAATMSSPVGTYPITPSGLTSTNYAITFVPGTLTITYSTSGTCNGDVGHVIRQPINADG